MTERRRRQIRDQGRIRRSLSIVPSLFTIGNIFCGYFSIISTLRGNWDYAAVLIGIGYILDGLDDQKRAELIAERLRHWKSIKNA